MKPLKTQRSDPPSQPGPAHLAVAPALSGPLRSSTSVTPLADPLLCSFTAFQKSEPVSESLKHGTAHKNPIYSIITSSHCFFFSFELLSLPNFPLGCRLLLLMDTHVSFLQLKLLSCVSTEPSLTLPDRLGQWLPFRTFASSKYPAQGPTHSPVPACDRRDEPLVYHIRVCFVP